MLEVLNYAKDFPKEGFTSMQLKDSLGFNYPSGTLKGACESGWISKLEQTPKEGEKIRDIKTKWVITFDGENHLNAHAKRL